MQRSYIIILLILLSFGLKAQVYQAMPQAGYGPVKRFLTDSVLTIPTGINSLRNITGGRDAGQIRWNTTDSGFYVYSGYQWIKINIDSVSLSNRINGKLNISDTATMLSAYMRKTDTLSLSNRINLRVKYTDTASMLSVYLRKLDTASLSDRINTKQDPITLTTTGTSGLSTLTGATLNIPNYGGALTAYVPYSGATTDVTLGARNLTGTLLNADYSLQIKNEVGAGGASTLGYTSISSNNSGYYFYTSYSGGQKGAYFNYPASGTTFSYNLPVRAGTIALVEDTVSLSNRINAKIGATDTVSLSDRINLRVKYSDTASMLSPYLRKGDTSSLSNRINLKLNISDTASMLSNYQTAINARVKYTDTAAMLDPYLTAAVTSVGLSMPVAFNVSNSPVTSTGTIAVTGAGTAAQYIRGDGQLATLPSGASGGSSVAYYLNGSVNQGTIGGSVYYEINKTPIIGAGTDFSLAGNGLISQFITDVADPNRLQIPAGNWNFEMYMSASSSGGTPEFYVELLKYDGTNFTSIASSSANPEAITNGTTIDLYVTALAIPQTTLLATDRLAIRVYIVNSTGGRTITMHTENSHLCEIITTFAGGVSSLNGLTANTQYLAVDTVGSDFNINSLVDTHTFNLPTASATKRGALKSADWSTFNGKMNYTDTVSLSNRINAKLNSSDTVSLSNRINAKADALSGTTNTVPKFTSGTTIGNSNIKDDGSAVSVSTTAGSNGALQVGNYNGNILMNTTNSNGGLIFKNTSSSNKLWDISSFNNDLNFNESNISPTVMTLKAGGNVIISSLIGSGTRMVVADLNGVLSTQAISSDTTSLSNRINLKLNISDTASMLSSYQSAINSKQAAITLTTTGTSGAATFSSNTLNIPQYQAAGTYVTSVTGTSPIVSSGGTTPAISIPAATSSVNGYLSSTDWTTFNNKSNTSGTVTSVATGLGLSGGTITTSGTLLVDTSSASILSRQRAANTYATTSDLSGYLPLTGGTLTGDLNLVKSGNALLRVQASTNTAPVADIELMRGTSTTWGADGFGDYRLRDSIGNLAIQYGDNNVTSTMLTITSTGNVGIGTTSPPAVLTSANTGALTLNSNDGNHTGFGLYVQAPSTTSTISSAIGFGTGARKLAAIAMQTYADADQAGLNFYVQPTASGSAAVLTEAMRITSDGDVGIGTTAPGAALGVLKTSSTLYDPLSEASRFPTASQIYLTNLNAASNSFAGITFQVTRASGINSNAYIGAISTTVNPDIVFGQRDGSNTLYAERMRIFSDGNVGIGTGATNNASKLQVAGNLSLTTAGNKLLIATGTNASAGTTAAMTAGTITVSTTAVLTGSIIQLTAQTTGGTAGALRVSSRTNATSFVITSSSALDTSTVGWVIIN